MKNEDNEALARFALAFVTLGGNHAYLAARATYRRTWGAERTHKANVRVVEADRERRYAAIGVTPRG
jgi:hypothetical protein